MQKYWWPGFELKLLEKLQRQQNKAQFCDTLLQSDGISIPTHSCILAAFSPYLSERLLASASPPFGQKRHLKLHTVKGQTLLKLVALIYCGEVEVNLGMEQSDLLAAATKLGITDLVEGRKQDDVEERCHQRVNGQSVWDSCESREGVQDAQMVQRREFESPVRATSCACAILDRKTASSLCQEEGLSEYTPPQNVDFCATSTPLHHLNIEDNLNALRSERIPSSRLSSSDDPELSCSFNGITQRTAPWPANPATTSFNNRVHQGGREPLQSPALTDMISVKVKLVRTQGEVWEVADVQNTKTLPVPSSLKRTTLQSNSMSSSLQSSPAFVPGTPTISPPPPLLSPASTGAAPQPGYNHPLIQSGRPCYEEPDEQMEVLLDDIMMGLNILPGGQSSCRNLAVPQPSQDRAQVVCPAQEGQSQGPAPAAASDGDLVVYRQDYRTQTSLCSTETDQTHSSSLSPSSLQRDAPQCHPPESSLRQRESTSPTSKLTAENLSSFFTPAVSLCRGLPTQDREDILLAIDDLHLTQFLSPLRPVASAGKPSLLFEGPRTGCYRTQKNFRRPGTRQPTENPETHPWTLKKSQRRAETRVSNNPQAMSEDEPRGGGATQLMCKKRGLRCPEEACVWQVREGVQTQIQLSTCSVSLSSNNVLAKDRDFAVGSSGKSRGTWSDSTDSSQIQTRGFLKRIHEASSQRPKPKAKRSSVSKATVCMSDAVDNGEVAPLKRKPGRPSKKGRPKKIVAVARDPVPKEQQCDRSTTLADDGGIKTKRKRRRKTQDAEAIPYKRTRSAGKVKAGDNCNVALTTERTSPTRTGKIKRRFAQRPKATVTRVNGNQDEGTNKPEQAKRSSDYKLIEGKDAAENQDAFTPALDENSNPLEIAEGNGGNSCNFTGDEVSLQCDELHRDKLHGKLQDCDKLHHGDNLHGDEVQVNEFHGLELHGVDVRGDDLHGHELHGYELQGDKLQVGELQGDDLHCQELQGDEFQSNELQADEVQGDLIGEEMGQSPATTTERLQNLGEAQRSGSDSTTQNNTLPQGNKSLSDCIPNLEHHNIVQQQQVPFNRPCQNVQVDVEGEEEEIEVVLYSPAPQLTDCENILDMLEAEEEEEEGGDDEDLSEIDVTGDEAE